MKPTSLNWQRQAIVFNLGLSAMLWFVAIGCQQQEAPVPDSASSARSQNSRSNALITERSNHADDDGIERRLQKLETICDSLAGKVDQLVAEQKALNESFKLLHNQGELTLDEAKTAKSLLIGNVDVERLKYDRNVALGAELLGRGEFEAATHYFSKAIDVHPNGYIAFVNRGAALQHLNRWHEALVDFKVARELDPDNYVPWNNAAWLLATCPNDEQRNGKEAFTLATKAGELTNWKDAGVLSTLAAAHAERGEFDAALNRIKEAIELAPEEARAELLEQQTQFEAHNPIRLQPSADGDNK